MVLVTTEKHKFIDFLEKKTFLGDFEIFIFQNDDFWPKNDQKSPKNPKKPKIAKKPHDTRVADMLTDRLEIVAATGGVRVFDYFRITGKILKISQFT